jgi:hypothetical protein
MGCDALKPRGDHFELLTRCGVAGIRVALAGQGAQGYGGYA